MEDFLRFVFDRRRGKKFVVGNVFVKFFLGNIIWFSFRGIMRRDVVCLFSVSVSRY